MLHIGVPFHALVAAASPAGSAPELLVPFLLGAALLLLLAVLILQVVLRPRSGGMEERLAGRLATIERQQADAGERLRTAFESALRDMQTALASGMEEKSARTVKVLYERFEQMQESTARSLSQARGAQDERLDKVDAALGRFRERLDGGLAEQRNSLHKMSAEAFEKQAASSTAMQELLTARLEALRTSTGKTLQEVQESVRRELVEMRKENEARLEKMRETVDEKLQGTLEKRLGQSFELVSKQLESVSRGLGEMQTLATGVGDLKRVLGNVSSRGALGEVQLAALLEQILAPAQYRANVSTIPGTSERVEFAVILPGDDESDILLPIDCKFPTEDYQRLQEAYEAADKDAAAAARKALQTRLLIEARTIEKKYVLPPHTTNFALLFLPTEGLFAEALRIPGLVEELQRKHRVVLVGPTTLYAYLNALQMGFRTLAIQERSGEVWRLLSAVKAEFHKFGDSLAKVKKNLVTATNNIGRSEVRTRAIARHLRGVETLDTTEAQALLPDANGAGTDDEDDNDDETGTDDE